MVKVILSWINFRAMVEVEIGPNLYNAIIPILSAIGAYFLGHTNCKRTLKKQGKLKLD